MVNEQQSKTVIVTLMVNDQQLKTVIVTFMVNDQQSKTVRSLFVLFLLAIVLSVLLRLTDFDLSLTADR
jgi:uncharacterized membrane protein